MFCLQEIWLPEQQQQINKTVKGKYPYIVSAIDLERDIKFNKTPACDLANFQILLSCIDTNCRNMSAAETQACSGILCYQALNLLSTECVLCLYVAGRREECLNDPISLYQQTFGLMLLSKFELTDVHVQSFTPEADDHAAARGYIEVNVSFPT